MTLVAVLSDTHLPRGRRRLPDECVRRLAAADLILHAGDIATEGVLHELGELGEVLAVCGNADETALQEALPRERMVEVGGARIGIGHIPGPRKGRERRLLDRFPGCGAIVYGHTHVPQVERHAGVWLLNPGSPTERRRAPYRSLLELRIEEGRIDARLIELSA